ncbi:hypothetical protein [Ferrimonas balearica]|uniref:hypothetical protein n=1 Tax=Ferrimonas balearica TaxID=44012 RepID=UPI001C56348C|nr:hypothetical protein [Ferrimonas balearica]MBW3141389.1 hypothetical protein [Ferrimonas balearica]MBY6108433.1 hypothetical protein [Ferrimonas balearica]MBY6226056.1 hypothetical protein [Ferrimonas balearica]
MSPLLTRSAAALTIALSLASAHAASQPNTAIQSFEVEGIAHYQDGTLRVNGVTLTLDKSSKFDDWWLGKSTLDGRWIKVEGFHQEGQYRVSKVDGENRDNDIELNGMVHDNALWGYPASDESLAPFNNQWVALECQLDESGKQISLCHLDD